MGFALPSDAADRAPLTKEEIETVARWLYALQHCTTQQEADALLAMRLTWRARMRATAAVSVLISPLAGGTFHV